MVNTKLEAQRQTILHYWLNGIYSAKEIHQNTKIPLRTILVRPRLHKVMAWGGISMNSKTSLFCFTDIMDGPFYVNILQAQLLPFVQQIYGRKKNA